MPIQRYCFTPRIRSTPLRDNAAFKELRRDIVNVTRAVDILIHTHRPTIGNELDLTGEEICSIFSISKRSLQNYRNNR